MKVKRISIVIALVLTVMVIAETADLRLDLSYDVLSLQATPVSVKTVGFDLDYFSPPQRNVSMGLGLGWKWLMPESTETALIDDTTPGNLFELYSAAVYRGRISESMGIEILSRGGVAVPDFKFDLTGYFAEVNVLFGVVFYGLDFRFGFGVKMYSFGDTSLTQIPIKLSVGKVF